MTAIENMGPLSEVITSDNYACSLQTTLNKKAFKITLKAFYFISRA